MGPLMNVIDRMDAIQKKYCMWSTYVETFVAADVEMAETKCFEYSTNQIFSAASPAPKVAVLLHMFRNYVSSLSSLVYR